MRYILNRARKSALPGKPVCKWNHAPTLFHSVSFLHLLFKYNCTYGSIILQSIVREDEDTVTISASAPRPSPGRVEDSEGSDPVRRVRATLHLPSFSCVTGVSSAFPPDGPKPIHHGLVGPK